MSLQRINHDVADTHDCLWSATFGEQILIGNQPFQIRGVIASEPGRSLGAFSLGPRVIIDYTALTDTGLLSFGSRASRQLLLKVPQPAVEPLTVAFRSAFANEFVGVRSYQRSEDQMGENLTRAENYLSLVGLVVLILGGIGVSSVTRVFVQQKLRSIAILKCVGATSGEILAVYMTQAPSPIRAYYRKLFKQLVYGAIID